MNHPIYEYRDVARVVSKVGYKLDNDEYSEHVIEMITKIISDDPKLISILRNSHLESPTGEPYEKFVQEALTGLALITVTFLQIASTGHVYIDGRKYDWDSETSRKTINLLRPSDIKFPFKAGVVRFDEYDVFFSWIPHRPSGVGGLSLHKATSTGDFSTLELYWTENIGERLKTFSEANQEFFYRTISVLLYVASFRNNRERVESKNVKAKLNKKKGSPTHKVNYISLKQKPLEKIKHHDGRSWVSDKTWIVRGHWRFYKSGEIIWIDQYWKGVGKVNFQEKIYKA